MVEKIPLNWLNPKRQIFPFLVTDKFDLTILILVLTFKNTFSLTLNFFFNHIVTKIIVQSRSQKNKTLFLHYTHSLFMLLAFVSFCQGFLLSTHLLVWHFCGFDWTLRVYFDVNLMQIFLHTNNIWVSTYGTQCRYKFKILSYIQIISRLARMVRSAFIYWEVSASTVIKDLLFLKRFINILVKGSTTLPSEIAPTSSLKHRCWNAADFELVFTFFRRIKTENQMIIKCNWNILNLIKLLMKYPQNMLEYSKSKSSVLPYLFKYDKLSWDSWGETWWKFVKICQVWKLHCTSHPN